MLCALGRNTKCSVTINSVEILEKSREVNAARCYIFAFSKRCNCNTLHAEQIVHRTAPRVVDNVVYSIAVDNCIIYAEISAGVSAASFSAIEK